MTTTETLREVFAGLPEETEREYELKLTRMVNQGEATEEVLLDILDHFNVNRATYSEPEQQREEKISYAALYCLNILYRHAYDIPKFQDVVQDCRDWCCDHETFHYLELLQCIHVPEELRGREEGCLRELYRYTDDHPNNAGYAHAVANLYANICEGSGPRQEAIRRRWQDRAEEAIRRAQGLDPGYALYYATAGRIALVNENFDEADVLFEQAIHRENSAAWDYNIRISKYLAYKSQIRVLRAAAQAQAQINELKAASVSNIEVLSFFAGVVAFLIGSFSLASGQTAADAAVLIVVLMGALLVVFSAFSFLLHFSGRREGRLYLANIAVALLGAALIIGGIWFVSPH